MIGTSSPLKHIPPFSENQKIGNYSLQSLVSVGYLGDFYKAKNLRTNEPVDLDILSDYFDYVIGLKKKVTTLLERSEELSSLRIQKIISFERIDNHWVISHSSIAYSLLRDCADKFTTDASLLSLVIEIVEGLDQLHKNNLYIPNLNPTNVLLTEKKEVKLQGYGLLQIAGKKLLRRILNDRQNKTLDPHEINSLTVLHPEVLNGNFENPEYDFYALGNTIYWLMTGRLPEIKNYQSITNYNSNWSIKWDEILRAMLGLRTNLCYSSAGQVLEDLKQFSSKREFAPKTVPPFHKEEKAVEASRPNKKKWMALVGVVTLLAGGVIGYGYLHSDDKVIESSTPISVNILPSAGAGSYQVKITGYPQGTEILVAGASAWSPLLPDQSFVQLDRIPEKVILRHPSEENVSWQPSAQPEENFEQWDSPWGHQNRRFSIKGSVGATITLLKKDELIDEFTLAAQDDRKELLLSPGEYQWKVEKEDHATKEIAFTLVDQTEREFDLQIDKLFAAIQLPECSYELEVSLDGERLNDLSVLERIKPDQPIDIVLSRSGFLPVRYEVTLGAGENVQLEEPRWDKNSGVVTFTLDPAGGIDENELSLSVNNQNIPFSKSLSLPVGQHEIGISHPNFEDYKSVIVVESGEEHVQPLSLIAKPARLEVVLSEEREYQLLNEATSQVLSPVEGNKYLLPVDQSIALRIDIMDAFSVRQTFVPTPNQKINFEVEVRPLPAPKFEQVYRIPYTQISLAWIGAGQFKMGSDIKEKGRLPNEGPAFDVRILEGYWMSTTEIRQSDYLAFMQKNPSINKGGTLPVNHVSWNEAQLFVEALNERERTAGRLPKGYRYKLPNEAEWEYAARAGSTSRFAYGNTIDQSQANFLSSSSSNEKEALVGHAEQTLKPVESTQPNKWGLFDMHGNVAEWTEDVYQSRLPVNTDGRWSSPTQGTLRTIRGGHYASVEKLIRCAARDNQLATAKSEYYGIRIVLAQE